MTFRLAIIACSLLSMISACQQQEGGIPSELTLTSGKDSISYGIGMQIAQNIKQTGVTSEDLDPLTIAIAMRDVLEEKDPAISEQEAGMAVQKFMMAQQQKQQEEMLAKAEENLAKGEEFLAANKSEEGVVTTESGLQYLVLQEGDGEKPSSADQVTVHYTGTLIDGTVFDSSVERGQPATFGVTQVIPGWVEGLQLMQTGAKYKFFIPSDLAYGPRGSGPKIGPNEALIFEVELISIVAAPAAN